jgi:hypothetical protein
METAMNKRSICVGLLSALACIGMMLVTTAASAQSLLLDETFDSCSSQSCDGWTLTSSGAGIDLNGAGHYYSYQQNAWVWNDTGWNSITSAVISSNINTSYACEAQAYFYADLNTNDAWFAVRDASTNSLLAGAESSGYNCGGCSSSECSQVHIIAPGASGTGSGGALCQGEYRVGESYAQLNFFFNVASSTEEFYVIIGTNGSGSGGGMDIDNVTVECTENSG